MDKTAFSGIGPNINSHIWIFVRSFYKCVYRYHSQKILNKLSMIRLQFQILIVVQSRISLSLGTAIRLLDRFLCITNMPLAHQSYKWGHKWCNNHMLNIFSMILKNIELSQLINNERSVWEPTSNGIFKRVVKCAFYALSLFIRKSNWPWISVLFWLCSNPFPVSR